MLGLGLGLDKGTLQGFETLVKSAGGVSYYDARKDLILANGVTPDRSGKGNDITWANFAGSAASGLIIEDGKVFRRLDGTDDFGSMVNTSSIDVLSAPLAEFATLRITAGAGTGFISCKNLDSAANIQYSLLYNSVNQYFYTYMEGANVRATSGNGSVATAQWYNVGYIWDGTNVKMYLNGILITGTVTALSGNLTSRPYARIGRRETATAYLKGDLAIRSFYSGAKATETNILKAEKQLSKAYIGG